MPRSKFATALIAGTLIGAPLTSAAANHHEEKQVDTRAAITVLAPHVETDPAPDLIGQERQITASAVVYYDDLNLRTEEGKEEFNTRVNMAAKEVCDWIEDVYPIQRDLSSEYDCVRNTMAETEPRVKSIIADHDA